MGLLFCLVVHRRQLVAGRRGNYGSLFGSFCLGLRVKSVEDGGANKNGKEEGDYVHANTEKEGLQAADCVKSSSIHWILD
jgi:hypothetical protein